MAMRLSIGLLACVLAALAASGQAEETLVIYTGDHGYMLGQHGRFEKHCGYEPAVRSPLVMRMPGKIREGTATSALVEFVDIVPTVLESYSASSSLPRAVPHEYPATRAATA